VRERGFGSAAISSASAMLSKENIRERYGKNLGIGGLAFFFGGEGRGLFGRAWFVGVGGTWRGSGG